MSQSTTMKIISGNDLKIIHAAGSGYDPVGPAMFGLARGTGDGLSDDTLMLVRPSEPGVALADGVDYVVHPVPGGLDPETAAQAPLVASALQAWEELGLEFGEVALVAGQGMLARLFSQVAVWCGACPVIRIGSETDRPMDGVGTWLYDPNEPETALEDLASRLSALPAAAAVDLTGEAMIADIFFEVLPQYGRLMLAGDSGEKLTVDYYVNIHRKGVRVLGRILTPEATIGVGGLALHQAFRLLAQEDRVVALKRLKEWVSDGST